MNIIKILRPKHYIKNFLVFLPLFFSGTFFTNNNLKSVALGFIIFCLLSSSVYVINDIKDVKIDRLSKKIDQ